MQLRWTRGSEARNYLTRQHEPIQPHLLLELARQTSCDAFLDIGANIGFYSLLFAQQSDVTTIDAFEPSPDTFAELQRNIMCNGMGQRIRTHRVAASSESGTVTFGVVHSLSGANSIVDTSIHAKETFTREVQVEAVALDDYLKLSGQRLCIKLDVEGHELDSLRGMRRLLRENEIVLQVESFRSGGDELRASLSDCGLEEIFAIRADHYFTSHGMAQTPEQIVRIFERAASALIEENLAEVSEQFSRWGGVWPVTVEVPRWMRVQLLGATANFVRKIKHPFRN